MSTQGIMQRAAARTGWAMTCVGDWVEYHRRRSAFNLETRGLPVRRIEEPIGSRTRHTYRIAGDKAFTTFGMDQRWRIVSRLYPEKLTSLLDIGCCRGWFVLKAAMRPECERALGIDVVPGFIDAANDAKKQLNLDKAQFEYAFLDDLVNDPQKYRTPYQTIVLLNTYHYMFWGSSYAAYSPKHWADHDFLLRTLAELCTDQVLFMSPLEIDECPSDIAKRAQELPQHVAQYTTEHFMEAANRYFNVRPQGRLGLRPLYQMKKK